MVIVGIIVIIYLFMIITGAVLYIFNSYGLYKLAKNEENKNAYIAWVPYLNRIIEGKIAFGNATLGITMFILQLLSIILMIVTVFSKNMQPQALVLLSVFSFILSAIFKIIDFVAHYSIYSKYSKSTILMTILDILSLGLLGPIFIFAIRDNELKEN